MYARRKNTGLGIFLGRSEFLLNGSSVAWRNCLAIRTSWLTVAGRTVYSPWTRCACCAPVGSRHIGWTRASTIGVLGGFPWPRAWSKVTEHRLEGGPDDSPATT